MRTAIAIAAVLLAGSAQAADTGRSAGTAAGASAGTSAGAGVGSGSAARGEQSFARNCRICHAPPFTGFFMLARRLGEAQGNLEQRGQVEPAYVRLVVRNGLNSMPHIGRGSVPDAELDDIIAYLNRGAAAADAAGGAAGARKDPAK